MSERTRGAEEELVGERLKSRLERQDYLYISMEKIQGCCRVSITLRTPDHFP